MHTVQELLSQSQSTAGHSELLLKSDACVHVALLVNGSTSRALLVRHHCTTVLTTDVCMYG
jgi:hypothetical protein